MEARRAYVIGPTSAGRVKAVRIDVGDVVAAGELVAEMDPVDLNDRIAAAQAALERAGNTLAAAEAQVGEAVSRQKLAESNARSSWSPTTRKSFRPSSGSTTSATAAPTRKPARGGGSVNFG